MQTLKRAAAAILAVAGSIASPALAQFSEVEPNGTKFDSVGQGVVALASGGTISGTTTGTLVTAGNTAVSSADTFLIQTAPAPLGIYRHRLTITSTTTGHSGTLRGLNQVAGVIGVADTSLQASSATSVPPRFNQWYGFGRSENVFYRIAGTPATTAPYQLTLSTVPVTPTIIGPLSTGTITLNGATGDTEVLVYDSALNPIPGFLNDDVSSSSPFSLTRTFGPGTYYIAVGRANTASDQPSPPDDFFRGGPVFDFPNIVASSAVTASANMSFTATDCAGPVSVAATLNEPFQVLWFQVTVGCPDVSIATQPVSSDICEGHPAVFQVSSNGVANYQWRYNGVDIPGATFDTLIIPAVTLADAGAYDVVVSNCCGSVVTSTQAVLTVHDDGPEITLQPQPLSLCLGSTAEFTVAAEAHMGNPLTYQWRKDGINIPGAIAPTLIVAVSSLTDGGQYDCVVTEFACGSNTSTPALLTVRNSPPLITPVGPASITLGCQSAGYVELGAVAVDDCDAFVPVVISGDIVGSNGPGVYIVRYNAVDSQGNVALEATRTVTVQDDSKPIVTLVASNPLLLKRNHSLVNIGLTATVTDQCGLSTGQPTVTIRVFCDEAELPSPDDGSGAHAPDAKDLAPGTLRLRSERAGTGNGRVYLIVASATDAAGNTGFGYTVAVCPHSSSHKAALAVASEALAALAAVASNAGDATDVESLVAPLVAQGWVEHGTAPITGPHQ